VAAVELLRDAVVTSWARAPIVLFVFHSLAPLLQICLHKLNRSHHREVGNIGILMALSANSSCRTLTLLKQQIVHRVRRGILCYFGVTTDTAICQFHDRSDIDYAGGQILYSEVVLSLREFISNVGPPTPAEGAAFDKCFKEKGRESKNCSWNYLFQCPSFHDRDDQGQYCN
jgi:hypothetical protein